MPPRTIHAGARLPSPRLGTRGARDDRLTDRETQLVLLAARGYDYRAIGQALGLTPKTVKNYFGHVLRKLGVRNRTEAAVLLWRRGVVPSPAIGPHCDLPRGRIDYTKRRACRVEREHVMDHTDETNWKG